MPSTYVHMKRRRLMVAQEKEPNSQSKYLSDSDSSNENKINTRLKTLVEERQYNTIPGSAIVTCIALSYSRVQVNPTVERGPPHQEAKTNKPSAEKTKAETSSTPH